MVTDYFAGADLRRRRTSGLLKMPSLSRLENSDRLIAGWCSSVLQPFFEMSDFIVAQLIPGKGGPRVFAGIQAAVGILKCCICVAFGRCFDGETLAKDVLPLQPLAFEQEEEAEKCWTWIKLKSHAATSRFFICWFKAAAIKKSRRNSASAHERLSSTCARFFYARESSKDANA